MNNNIPYSILIKIILTRIVILWEVLAKYLFFLVGILIIFLTLTLLNFFTYLSFWFHILLLAVFLIVIGMILTKAVLLVRWPSIMECARRIEIDNLAPNRPISTLFDKPILNKHSPIWDIHYNKILKQAHSLGYFQLRPFFHSVDPLYICLPLCIIFLITIYTYSNNFITKVEAALLPQNNYIELDAAVFSGWISPPNYTELAPIVLSEEIKSIRAPVGSVLTARMYGGDGLSKLLINEYVRDFSMIDKDNYAVESVINSSGNLTIKQNNTIIFNKPLEVVEDQNPTVELLEKPESTVKGVLKITYLSRDDYGITNLYSHVVLKKNLSVIDQKELNFSLPFDKKVKGSQYSEYYYDLTEHIWAGLPVKFSIFAEDFVGNRGGSQEYEIILPEREFNNPLAISIINQRKNFGLRLLSLKQIALNLDEVANNEIISKEYAIAQVWLEEVLGVLKDLENNLHMDVINEKRSLAIKKLWKSALFIESGQLVKAEEDLRKAQENLRESLSESNDAGEIQESITNLDEALENYLDELEEPMNVDAPQVSESEDPGDRGGENGAESNERQDLEEKLEEIADLAVSGSLDEAKDQLDAMQDVTEALDREELGEALGDEESPDQPRAMQQISEMIQEQEALMEESFDQSLNSAQADQKTPGSGPVNAGEEQENLRKQLENVMKEIAESDNPIPESLGRADRAMRQASRELNRNRPDRAQAAQGRVIEELSKAAESLDKMHSGNGPSQMAGENRENTSRDQRDPLGRVPPGQGSSPGGDVGIPNEPDITKARKIAKQLYKKAEKSVEDSIERKYVDSLLDWY